MNQMKINRHAVLKMAIICSFGLIMLLGTGCSQKPPKEVLENAELYVGGVSAQRQWAKGAEKSGDFCLTDYHNLHKRTINGETYHCFTFTYSWRHKGETLPYLLCNVDVAFIKRGKHWESRFISDVTRVR